MLLNYLTANTDMNNIHEEYLQISSNIHYTLPHLLTRLLDPNREPDSWTQLMDPICGPDSWSLKNKEFFRIGLVDRPCMERV